MKWVLVVVVFGTMPLKTELTLNSRRVLNGRRGNAGGIRSRVQPLALWDEEIIRRKRATSVPSSSCEPRIGVGKSWDAHSHITWTVITNCLRPND
jgi:hypothetical protein